MVVSSLNETINGTVFGACHEGAAIEGFCRAGTIDDAPERYTTFYHNTSDTTNSSTDNPGVLSYDFYYSENPTMMVPSAMTLSSLPTSDTAIPIIYPDNTTTTYVSFDECGSMYIGSYTDDRTSPPSHEFLKVYNWYLCTTYYAYTYTTLAWAMGGVGATPQNPTCQKIDVKRVFI
ncbi:uncharacterized protein BDR25DRAFT_223139 [Lindgomyces ingoldianus]|uniref:Uncharacterized protein n=1 Tax=Lindgomyces ingoldianus TaxID=673940 RepID=A0ACB6QY82_9PLEO|nr:uncharacterized protein BDR25DRAFT_223139 [Lindgomyces ingoldianus]KAF2471237.1 hypothetical protein BDR25DRAFT_223139 [Lindgomyces ingoldianus]